MPVTVTLNCPFCYSDRYSVIPSLGLSRCEGCKIYRKGDKLICSNCKEKEITSPKLTGELCTSCYFKSKKANDNKPTDEQANTAQIVERKESTIESNSDSKESNSTTDSEVEETVKESTKDIKVNVAVVNGKNVIIPKDSFFCNECNEIHKLTNSEEVCLTVHAPKKVKLTQPVAKEDSKVKYCQSCIERGFDPKPATREWKTGYFICDDCFGPLINQLANYEATRAEIDKVKANVGNNSPALAQVYDILEIPEGLRYNSSDDVLRNRNDIFNYHANMIANMSFEEVQTNIEFLQVVLFQIRIGMEPLQDYINKVKHEERLKRNVDGIAKSKKEIGKKPSKVKLTKLEKEAKALGMSVEQYQELVTSARQKQFDKIVDPKS